MNYHAAIDPTRTHANGSQSVPLGPGGIPVQGGAGSFTPPIVPASPPITPAYEPNTFEKIMAAVLGSGRDRRSAEDILKSRMGRKIRKDFSNGLLKNDPALINRSRAGAARHGLTELGRNIDGIQDRSRDERQRAAEEFGSYLSSTADELMQLPTSERLQYLDEIESTGSLQPHEQAALSRLRAAVGDDNRLSVFRDRGLKLANRVQYRNQQERIATDKQRVANDTGRLALDQSRFRVKNPPVMARNPQTGETLQFINGQWVPVQ